MSGFKGVCLVAARELKERGRSKAYLISSIFTIIIVLGAIFVPALLGGDGTTHQIGLVGDGGPELVDAAAALAEQRATEDEPAELFEIQTFESVEEAEAALDEGTIDTAIVDATALLTRGGGFFGGSSADSRLQEAAATVRIQDLVAENAEAAEVVELLASEPLEVRRIGEASEEEQAIRGAIAFGGLILMYMAVLTYGTWMLSGVTEEKTNRVVEVLLSTLKPWQIFAGKLVGIGLLGVGQMAVLIAIAFAALSLNDTIDLPSLPVDSVIALIGWFILGFLLYATLFGAAGSLVSRMEDAQNAAAPLSILAVVGYLFSFTALGDPGGTVAVVGTYIPFTAPYVAPIRLAFGEITGLEMALAVAITIVTIVLMVRLAGRVYAGGLLRFGSRVKWSEAFRSAS
jgi:ABC-2 type transport system permease protein